MINVTFHISTLEDLEGVQSIEVEARQNDVEDNAAQSGKECHGYIL